MMRALERRAENLQPKVVEALADPSRHGILRALLERRGWALSFTEIRSELSIRNSGTLSHHLAILQRAWLVEKRSRLGNARTAKDPYYSFYTLTSLGEQVAKRVITAVDKSFLEEHLTPEDEASSQPMSLREAAEIAGISVGTLSYWVRTGLVVPRASVGDGRGRRYQFSMLNLIEIMAVDRLRRRGLPMQRLRKAVDALEEQVGSRPLARLTLVTDGEELFRVVEGDEELATVVRRHDGQGVFAITLGNLIREVREKVDAVTP